MNVCVSVGVFLAHFQRAVCGHFWARANNMCPIVLVQLSLSSLDDHFCIFFELIFASFRPARWHVNHACFTLSKLSWLVIIIQLTLLKGANIQLHIRSAKSLQYLTPLSSSAQSTANAPSCISLSNFCLTGFLFSFTTNWSTSIKNVCVCAKVEHQLKLTSTVQLHVADLSFCRLIFNSFYLFANWSASVTWWTKL